MINNNAGAHQKPRHENRAIEANRAPMRSSSKAPAAGSNWGSPLKEAKNRRVKHKAVCSCPHTPLSSWTSQSALEDANGYSPYIKAGEGPSNQPRKAWSGDVQ